MTRVLLDGNIYNCLAADQSTRERLAARVRAGDVAVFATPVIVDELAKSPFGGIPNWFPVTIEAERLAVLGYWRLGMAYLSDGKMFAQHKGDSQQVPDAILAHTADAVADILVTEDKRCRKRLNELSSTCRGMSFAEFRQWLNVSDQ